MRHTSMHVVCLFALPLIYHIACLFKAASSCRRRLPTGVLVDLLLGPHPTLPWSLVLHYQDPPSSNTTSSTSATPAAAGAAAAAGAVGLHNQLDVRGELLNSLKVSRGGMLIRCWRPMPMRHLRSRLGAMPQKAVKAFTVPHSKLRHCHAACLSRLVAAAHAPLPLPA